jgi:hypothetical protein
MAAALSHFMHRSSYTCHITVICHMTGSSLVCGVGNLCHCIKTGIYVSEDKGQEKKMLPAIKMLLVLLFPRFLAWFFSPGALLLCLAHTCLA